MTEEFCGIHIKILRLLVISSQTSPMVLATKLNTNCCSVELNLNLQNQFHVFIIISICHESYTWLGNATTSHGGVLGGGLLREPSVVALSPCDNFVPSSEGTAVLSRSGVLPWRVCG